MKSAGNYYYMIHTMRQDDGYNRESVVGILFAKPNVTFVKYEILNDIEYANKRSGQDIDFFFAGYIETDKEYGINELDKTLIVAPEGRKWRYDAEMFTDFIKCIEDTSKWKYSGETELLLLDFREGELHFDKSLVIWLDRAVRDRSIYSVSNLFENIYRKARSITRTNKLSNKCELNTITSYIIDTIRDYIIELFGDQPNICKVIYQDK